MSTNWTAEQRDAIDARGGTVLVSAAAGSGKTAVLSERVLRRLTDPDHPVDADRLLVVTFTKAAAAEMKQRIADKLTAYMEQNPGSRALQRQLLLLDHAHISTVHRFCSELLHAHFHQLGISPTFRIASEDELLLLSGRVIDSLSEWMYHRLRTENPPGLRALTELFSDDRDDRRLGQTVRALYEYVRSHPFPEEWLRSRTEAYRTAAQLRDTAWGRVLFDYARDAAASGVALLEGALAAAADDEKVQKAYSGALMEELSGLARIHDAAEQQDWDALATALQRYNAPRLGAARGADEAVKARVKDRRDAVHGLIDRLSGLFDEPEADAVAELHAQYDVVHALAELVMEYGRRLDALKAEKNLLDFGDLEHDALRLLVTRTESGVVRTPLAEELAQQFDEVMVDEYQDTNGAQELIFTALSRAENNLFLVGDVKQSIYRFRQASPELFLARRARYPLYSRSKPQFPALILLGRNFRSRAGVTGACNFLFRQLMSPALGDVEYNHLEELIPQARYVPSPTPDATLALFEAGSGDSAPDEPEAEWIAARIRAMMAAGTPVTQKDGSTRPAQYRDFCILLRSAATRASDYLHVLQQRGIPCWGSVQSGFFESREISFLLALLRVIDNPAQDIPLLAVLCSPVYGFLPDALAEIRLAAPRQPLYAALQAAAEGNARVAAFLNELAHWRRAAAAGSVRALLDRVREEKQLDAIVLAMKDGTLRLANVRLLAEYAGTYEQAGYRGLSGFIRYIDRLQEQHADLAPASVLSESANVVRVMTIHHAKGLEFPFVFVADCARSFNKQSLAGDLLLHPELGAALRRRDPATGARYLTAAYNAVQLELGRDELSEQLRVLYVALTRPREKLFLLCTLPKPEETLRRLAGKLSGSAPIAPFTVREASSFADWLLLGLLRHPDMAALRTLAGAQGLTLLPDDTRWDFAFVRCGAAESAVPEAKTPAAPDRALLDALAERLAPRPASPLSRIPVKAAISALAERQQARAYAAARRPAFLSAGGLTPAERGTAMHTFLQFADYDRATANPAAERDRLREKGYLTAEQAAAIDLPRIAALFSGPLGQRIRAAGTVHREVRFLLEYPAARWDPPAPHSDAAVVLQGVADCVLEEGDALTLIDFKTDRVDAATLRARYGRQLALYAEALARCFGKPVRQQLLYSLYLGQTVELTP